MAKVLIVEDDPLLIKMYSSKFVKEGFEVVVAEDGQEGLNRALSDSPDFIILDVMMPKLSGIDMLTLLRKEEKGREVPVLVLSNLTSSAEEERATSLGAKEYLIKASFTPGQIVDKVKGYLGL